MKKILFAVVLCLALIVNAPPAAASSMDQQVISEINKARAVGRYCGSKWYPPVKPIKNNRKLAKSSRLHSKDMGVRNYFAHSYQGSTLRRRLKRVHYRWRNAGEIIAAGYKTPQSVVLAWLKSPGHCKVIMNPKYVHAGSGYVLVPDSKWTWYWTVEFGRPRRI